MAYLLPHTKRLFGVVAESDAPDDIRKVARAYADAPVDTVIPNMAWPAMFEALSQARWAGKKALMRQITTATRGGG